MNVEIGTTQSSAEMKQMILSDMCSSVFESRVVSVMQDNDYTLFNYTHILVNPSNLKREHYSLSYTTGLRCIDKEEDRNTHGTLMFPW